MSGEIDWAKASEFEEALDEINARQEASRKKRAKLFDPRNLVIKAKQLKTINDPEYGIITYGSITWDELQDINKESKSNDEKMFLILHKMLSKAYPDLTVEDIRNFPPQDITKLSSLLMEKDDFLRWAKKLGLEVSQTQSSNGLKTPTTFKGSDS